jgi:hypothetical protein
MKKLGVVLVPIVVLVCLVALLFTGGSGKLPMSCNPAGSDVVPLPTSTLPESVGSWSKPQLEVAAQGLTAAHNLGVNRKAATILIMTGMGESSLEVKTHGDAVDNTTIGWLQQGEYYGPVEARLSIVTSTNAFLTRLLGVEGWDTMEPTLAAHAVQINQDPFHYREMWDDAEQVVAALTGTGGQACEVTGDDQVQLAKTLMEAYNAGNFTDHGEPGLIEAEIGPIAEGKEISEECRVDVRLLQVLVLTVQKFGSVGISDMNRPCIGSSLNCPGSAHCYSPATAIDFVSLGGEGLSGANQASINLLLFLDAIVPTGSQAGQSDCRAGAGTSIETVHFGQFPDGCHHLHIDLRKTTDPLTIPAN